MLSYILTECKLCVCARVGQVYITIYVFSQIQTKKRGIFKEDCIQQNVLKEKKIEKDMLWETKTKRMGIHGPNKFYHT